SGLFCQPREVVEHLATVRNLAPRQTRRRRFERELSVCPRFATGARALDADLEALEANGLFHAHMVVRIGLHRLASCASIKSNRCRAAICALRRRTSSTRYLPGPLNRNLLPTGAIRSLDRGPEAATERPVEGFSAKSSFLAKEPSTRVMRASPFRVLTGLRGSTSTRGHRTRTSLEKGCDR